MKYDPTILTEKAIQKYEDRDTKWLKGKATETVNRWIRDRDSEDGWGCCICCGNPIRTNTKYWQACHFYSADAYNAIRFLENNIHGGCQDCNFYDPDHLKKFRENLIKKIGKPAFDRLVYNAAMSRRKTKKWNRFELIEIIEKYKTKSQ